ncbi:MAG TPA: hypothetical protein VM532_18680, partial [Burkholderiales bacterium]|nr:hypothetical protein [Burkholderiales bacterium]
NEDTQALCLRHPAIKDAYRQGQKPKWLSEQGLAPIFQAFDARIAELERIRLAGVGFVAVFRAAMLAEDESEAMEDADDLRGIMEEWNSEGNNADWDEILAIDPEWPNVVSEMLDVRIRKSRNVLRIPLDNQQDNRFIVTTRKWLAGDMTDAEFYKGTANERPQHRDLMSITKGFFNYYPDEPLPETMQKAQEFMLERPEKFREYALATLRNVTLTILETPGKSLAASYWEEFDIARHRDPNDVTRLANAFMSFIGAPDGPGGRGELQALTDLQIELGIDDDDTARFVLHFPEAEKAIFEGKSKPRWFNQQGLMSLLRLRALSAFTQTCEEAFKAEGVRAAQLTNRLRDMVERDWPNRDAFTHSLSNSQVWRESDGISPLLEEEISKTKDVLRIEVSPEQDEHFVTVAREYRASDDLDYFEQEIRAANYQYKDLLRGMGEYFHAYPRLPIPATTKAAQVWLMDSVDSTSETRTKLRPVVTMNVAADIVSFLTDDDGSGQTLAEWRQEKLNDLDITHRRSPEDVKKLAEAVMALDKAWASGPARQKRDEELTVLLTEKIGVATDERAKRLLLGRPEAAAIIKPPAGEDKKKWLDNLFDNRKLDIDRFMENLQRFSTAEGSEKLQLAYTLTMQREGVSENDWSALQNYAGELGEVDELVKEGVEQFAQAADRAGYALGESNEIESQIEAMEKKPPVDNKTLAGWMMPFIDAMDAEVSEAGQQKGESSKPSHNDINKALDNFDKRAAEITSPEAEGPALYQLNSLMDLDGEIAEKVWSVIEKERKRIVSVREKFPGKEAMLDSAFKASFKKEVESFLSELKKQHPVRADVIAAGLIRVGVPLITNLQIELPSGLAAAIEQAKRPLQCSVFEKIDEPMNGKMATALKAELLPSSLKWEQGDILDQLPPDKKSRRIESSDTFDNGLYFLRKCVSSNVAFFAHRDDKGEVEFLHKEITEMQRSGFNTSKLEPGYRYRVHPGKPVASPDIAPQQGPQRNDGSQSQQKSVKAKGGKSTGHGRS